MDFNGYQKETRKTDLGTGPEHNISPPWLYYVLGIAGETGELIEKIKKHFRDDYGVMTEDKKKQIIKESGDVLWYLARLLDELGIKFNDVALKNLSKLFKRMEEGTIKGEGDNR